MRVRVADIIAEEVAKAGARHVFMVTGGGAMHLNDAFGRNRKLEVVFNHHEQASAMAAESYCRLSGQLAVVNVTTGPGGINAMNGVYGAYTDSIAMLVVSGQVKRETMARNYSEQLRQLGDQEVDIVSMVAKITKYAAVLQDPKFARYIVQKALYIAQSGRPGPTWIDVPVDIQGTLIDNSDLVEFDPAADHEPYLGDEETHPNTIAEKEISPIEQQDKDAKLIIEKLMQAKRPVIFAGTGVRVSGIYQEFLALIDRLQVPVVTAFNAHDLLPDDHPCYAGRPGTVGNRAGNFSVQNSDFVLILGCRLNIRQISYNWKSFASRAWTAHVDVDRSELDKHTFSADLKINANLKSFVPLLLKHSEKCRQQSSHKKYLERCLDWRKRYPVVQPSYRSEGLVNPYEFMGQLFAMLSDDAIVVTGNGTACVTAFQAAQIKSETRLYSNSGSASMGYDLPAAIGAAYAAPGKRVYCLAGDGSIMMNLQELETIAGQHLPITVFLLNNAGYHSIRQTQKAYFSDNMLGIGPGTGLTFPDYQKISQAFGFAPFTIAHNLEVSDKISALLKATGPVFCEVLLDPNQDFSPKLASRKLDDGTMVSPSLEDMAPFLPREELDANMSFDTD